MNLEEQVKNMAHGAGFDLCGLASLDSPPDTLGDLTYWLNQGRHAEMTWMERQAPKRLDPRQVLVGARSLICVGLLYNTNQPYSTDIFPLGNGGQSESRTAEAKGWISRYAWGDDYHQVMARKLSTLELDLRSSLEPRAEYRSYCDTGPISEKVWAATAGIGWQGKNTNIINQKMGSWLFLGEILTTLSLVPDLPAEDHCGTCTRCMDACPTQAFPKAYELDAGRCISYLTIEKRGEIPVNLAEAIGANVYGCDICQDVCPWNRTRVLGTEASFNPRDGLLAPRLDELKNIDDGAFSARFKDSAIRRAKAAGLRRNAAIADASSRGRRPANEGNH